MDSLDQRDDAFVKRFFSFIEPFTKLWFRPEVRGLDRIPDGAALLVGNHNGGLLSADTFVLAIAVLRARGVSALPYGLAHEVALAIRGMSDLLIALGAVRASHDNAHSLFARGDKVLVYPGGDLEAMRPYSQRDQIVFGPRRGYIRLALSAGVPIVPVVAAGAHGTSIVLNDGRWLARVLRLEKWARIKVAPITFSVPWGFVVGITPPYFPLPTRILIEVMEPVHFDRSGEEAAQDAEYVEACHRQVVDSMQSTLTRLAHERRGA